jgi:hypothetical protein
VLGIGAGELAGIAGIAKGLELIVSESAATQDATSRLDRVYNAFSSTLGVSRGQLADFANAAAESSRFSSTEITNAQQTLIRFGSITGSTLKQAQQAVVDLGAQMGDLQGAASIVSRALAAPENAARSLRQAGIVLTKSQQDLIKSFTDVGDVASADKVILDELHKRYAGAAKDDLNTFSGAWDHLKNTLKGLANQQGALGWLTTAANYWSKAFSGFAPEDIDSKVDRLKKKLVDLYAVIQTRQKSGASTTGFLDQATALEQQLDAAKGDQMLEHQKRYIAAYNGALADQAKAEEALAQKQEEQATAALKQLSAEQAAHMEVYKAVMAEVDANGAYLEAIKKRDEETQTVVEKEAAAYNHLADTISQQVANGEITIAEGAKRSVDLLDRTLGEIDLKSKHVYAKPANDYSKAQLQAISEIQGAFSDMFHHVGDGIGGMLKAFLDALKEMVIRAAAAKLTDALFGSSDQQGNSTGGGTNWAKDIIGVASLFSGFASGGDAPGGLKVVGENGPELISSGPGHIWNSQQLAGIVGGGGGATYAPSTTINVAGSMDKATESRIYSYIEATRARDQREMLRLLQRNGMRTIR